MPVSARSRSTATLRSIARWRSKDMAVRNYFDHAIPSPPGGKVFNEMDRRGYCYKVAGENIGWNNASDSTATQKIMNAFMGSPGHKANILGSKWDRIGIGAYKEANGNHYWTVLFADSCAGSPRRRSQSRSPRRTRRHTRPPGRRRTRRRSPPPSRRRSRLRRDRRRRRPSRTAFDTSPPDSGGVDPSPAEGTPGDVGPDESPASGGGNDPSDPESFRVVDQPAGQGLFETIVGGVAGLFLGS